MSKFQQFLLGGIGGLMPTLLSLALIDLAAFASLVDGGKVTEGIMLGYGLRVSGLFLLGGIMAALSGDARTPLSVIQIGIAAPALMTSLLSGGILNKPKVETAWLISSAYAADGSYQVADTGFFGDVLKGLQPGLQADIPSLDPPNGGFGQPFYKAINPATSECLTLPGDLVRTQSDYDSLVTSFGQTGFSLSPGSCI